MKAPEIHPANPVLMESVVAALGSVPLCEARQRPNKGGYGSISIGDAFQVDNPNSPNGKATCVVRDINITYGIGEPKVRIVYDYKVGPTAKGQENMLLDAFLKAVGAS